jgi:hypothetical protein
VQIGIVPFRGLTIRLHGPQIATNGGNTFREQGVRSLRRTDERSDLMICPPQGIENR